MQEERSGYRGYVTSRPFGGLYIPVPVQSLVLRDYCHNNNFIYKLHVNENMFPHSYMVLEGAINEIHLFEGLLATSMYMFPQEIKRRRDIYDRILSKGAAIHFVLENFIIRKPEDIEEVEDILSVHHLLPPTKGGLLDEELYG